MTTEPQHIVFVLPAEGPAPAPTEGVVPRRVERFDAALAALAGDASIVAVATHASPAVAEVRALRSRFPGVALLPASAVPRELDEARALEQRLATGPAAEIVGEGGFDDEVSRPYDELLELLGDGAELPRLTAAADRDPAASLKVLQLFNWAFFGVSRRFMSLPQAFTLLGVEPLRSVVLTARTFALYERRAGRGYSLDHALSFSSRLARLARRFGAPHGQGSEAFAAALLLDLGKLVIALARPAESDRILRASFELGTPARTLEQAELGTTHAEVGARLLSLAGVPAPIIDAVALHHAPREAVRSRKLTALVHAADALASITICGDDASVLDRDAVEHAGLGSELAGWRAAAEQEDEHAAH
jgi:HD-like signal output (HDOD) protein